MISIFRCIYKKAFLSPGGDYLQYEERRKEEGGTARLKRRFQSSNLLPRMETLRTELLVQPDAQTDQAAAVRRALQTLNKFHPRGAKSGGYFVLQEGALGSLGAPARVSPVELSGAWVQCDTIYLVM